MTIGILTFHRACNCGAVLQCYALQETLRAMGHDARVIDYRQPYIERQFRPRRLFGLRSLCRAVARGGLRRYVAEAARPFLRAWAFAAFRRRRLRLTSPCGAADVPPMGLYIVGSDQPWNPSLTGGPDAVYLGRFARPAASHLATYAMSGSGEAFQALGWETLAECAGGFTALSFRETELSALFAGRTGRVCPTVLDPTLLAPAAVWEPFSGRGPRGGYVLLYHVGGPSAVIAEMTARARATARAMGLRLVDASGGTCSPGRFVSLVRGARLVVTASFHATAFAVVFRRDFLTVMTGQASDVRFRSLLGPLGLASRLVTAEAVSPAPPVEYASAAGALSRLRRESLGFLESVIRSCEAAGGGFLT